MNFKMSKDLNRHAIPNLNSRYCDVCDLNIYIFLSHTYDLLILYIYIYYRNVRLQNYDLSESIAVTSIKELVTWSNRFPNAEAMICLR